MEYKGPVITLWFLFDLLFGSLKGNLAMCAVILNGVWILSLRRGLLGKTLPFKTVTLPSFFLLAYGALMLLPSTIWFAYYESSVTFEFFVAVQAFPTFFILGGLGANAYFRSPATIIAGFFRSDIFRSEGVNKAMIPFFALAVVLELAIIATYLLQADLVPLFKVFSKNPLAKDEMRFAIYASGPVIIFLYAFAVRVLVPITILYPLYMMRGYGNPWRCIYWLSLALGLGISLLSLERQSSLSLICLLVLSVYFLQNQRIKLWQLVGLILFLGIVGGFVSIAQYGNQLSVASVVNRAVSYGVMRVMLDPSYMTYAIFDQYAGQHFLFGATIRILSFLGTRYEHLTAIGMVADLWVNYGWFGVILGPVLLGFLLQCIQLHFFRVRTVPTMIVYSIMMLSAGWLIYSNMMPTMIVTVFICGMLTMSSINRLSSSDGRLQAFH